MLKLFLVQLRKLFSRTDVRWMIAVFSLLPFGIAFLISIESGIVQIGNSVFTAMGYGSVIVGLFSSLFLISVTVALITTSLVSKEIDSGLDSMYVTRIRSRNHLIVSKMLALDVFVLCVFAALVISSVAGWLVFLKDSDFGTSVIWSANGDRDESIMLLYTLIGSFFETIVFVRIYTLFSLGFKYSKAIIFNFVTIVAFKLLANIEQIKCFIPSYIGSGAHLMEYAGNELIICGVLSIYLLIIYAVIFSIVSCLIYRKMDIAR